MLEHQDFAKQLAEPAKDSISIIVPVLNEQANIAYFIEALDAVIATAWPTAPNRPLFELIFVDDGSTDETAFVVREICRIDRRVRLVSLSRNFGKEAALSAGMAASSGDAVIPMDVDLQDPPELIVDMIAKWRSGTKIVNAKRVDRSSDSFIKRSSSRIFYRLVNTLADRPIDNNVGDYRLLDRDAVDVLNRMTEQSRFNKGLFSWIGFTSETIEYARPARELGKSKWKASALMNLALDGITSTTTFPLRIWTVIGASIAMLAFLYAAIIIIHTITTGIDAPGYASIMVAVLFLGGLNLLSLGLMGEYIGRIAVQVRNRPLYIISSKEGF